MALPLEPGMKFLVPLPDGQFLPGYVVHDGNMFTLVNIFSNAQSTRSAPEQFAMQNLLLRDYVIGDHVFSRSKKVIDTPWILFRTKKLEAPLPPEIDGMLIGSPGQEMVEDFATGKMSRTATAEDLTRLPRHAIKVAGYYSLAVQAALLGKEVVLDPVKREYVII